MAEGSQQPLTRRRYKVVQQTKRDGSVNADILRCQDVNGFETDVQYEYEWHDRLWRGMAFDGR